MQTNKARKRTLLMLLLLAVLPLAGCEAFAQGLCYGLGGNQPAYYQQPQQPYSSLSAEQQYYLQRRELHRAIDLAYEQQQQQQKSYDRSASTTYSPPTSYTPASTTYSPPVGENGSYRGQLNKNGIPKTVHVRGYYRKDGTYVRSHYRSPPGSNP